MTIPRETIDLVRDRAQLVEIVKRYVPSLKKRGANYIALCPFHKEKTPSFTVSPEKQIFHCFGCHLGGNVFSFVSKIEGLNFPESVRFVGDLVGIRVEDEKRDKNYDEFNNLKEINRLALELFHNTVKSDTGKGGLEYLLKRGVSKESIIEFKLGYSPDSWNYLVNFFNSKNISMAQAAKIGIVSISDKGGKNHYYDKFRSRVIFPIFSLRNDIIAFGGRIIGDGEPKYLNSPESMLFQKRRELYGFNIAKEHISDLKRAIVVEGYLDVIGCHQAGIKNVVAPLGTALTIDQVRQLSRFCNEIILLFDADSAGIKAALRSIDVIKEVNVDLKIAVLPEGDPFDFIKEKGIREFMAIVDQSLNPIEFRIKRAIADKNTDDRMNILLDIFKILMEVEYETEKDHYLKKVSSLLHIDENSIRADFKSFMQNRKTVTAHKDLGTISENNDFLTKSYQEMVILLCSHPELIEQAAMDFSESEFPDPVSRNIFKMLSDSAAGNDELTSEKIFDLFPDGNEKQFLEKKMFSEYEYENKEAAHNDYTNRYVRIKIEHIDKEIDRYANAISSLKNDTDFNKYLTEIELLRREKDRLSTYIYDRVI